MDLKQMKFTSLNLGKDLGEKYKVKKDLKILVQGQDILQLFKVKDISMHSAVITKITKN
jgi:hypothetical protein